jgi:hypothetical protein
MKCGQAKCEKAAEYRYFWPGDGKEHDICRACVPAVVRLGAAMGVPVKLTRIGLIDAKDNVLKAAVELWRANLRATSPAALDAIAQELHQLMIALSALRDEETLALQAAAELVADEERRMDRREEEARG